MILASSDAPLLVFLMLNIYIELNKLSCLNHIVICALQDWLSIINNITSNNVIPCRTIKKEKSPNLAMISSKVRISADGRKVASE